MVGGWATCVRFLRRKQGWSLLPRGIGQVMSVHTIKDTTQNRVCKHALVVFGRNNPSPYTVNGRPLYVHLNGLAIVLLK